MNKLDIKLGGHPLTGDDLLFLQSALSDAINGIASSMYGDLSILSGCELTIAGSTITWTAGWIFINGELCKIDAGTHNNWDGYNRFAIVETYDPAGNIVYESLATEDCYIIRKATIDNGGYGSFGGNAVLLATRFKDVRKLTAITPLGAWAWYGAVVSYALSPIGDVVFRGTIEVASYNVSTDTKIATLPAGFRPQEKRTFLCAATINTVKTFIHVEVDTNGDIKPLGLAATNAAAISLDGIRVIRGIY